LSRVTNSINGMEHKESTFRVLHISQRIPFVQLTYAKKGLKKEILIFSMYFKYTSNIRKLFT
jgi:hypothetical protein